VNVPVGEASYNGRLSLATPDAIIPLHGPGRWALRATHAVSASLQCGSRATSPTVTVVIEGERSCSLEINVVTGAPTSWTLNAAR